MEASEVGLSGAAPRIPEEWQSDPRAPGAEDTFAVNAVAEAHDEVLRVVVPDVELIVHQAKAASKVFLYLGN